ncbi:hypothetical protein L6452_35754 [Arctium lappa]|uniref:Uncharacterized protein n=1 Tax=Arctium lappa TaxID=4217 RepID=A0ACB8Y7F9_ARCLA|nr:hypothetical protein L6452_35754 [Arctium lappa]
MESTSHLQRMAEELKCPICLSLLKSAVSLTCNHIFCYVCIDKSMKSDATCPVCKIPYRRREVRPAPHMDTLVSIYKNMEVSSGVNILVTQTQPQMSGHEDQVENEIVCRSKSTSKACRDTPKTQNQRRKRGKALTGSSKRPKSHNSDPVRPSFPVKKRVQVPQHPLQETPTRPANIEGGKTECIKDRTQTNVSGPEDEAHLHENGETLFSPFFWLRDDGDAERTIEPTPVDPVNDSPPDAPCFSDIKDSDDHMTSKDRDIFDSEMFEWTQRPCSPELCSSPLKLQDKESDGCDRLQEKGLRGTSLHSVINVTDRIENEDHNTGAETDTIEEVLPTLSPLQIKKVNHEAKAKESKKRAKKTKESIQKKRVKRDTDEAVVICNVSPKADQDKASNTNDLVKQKKQIRRKGKKVPVDTLSTKALLSKDAHVCNGETPGHGDGSIVGLADSSSMREGSSNTRTANSFDENKNETTNQQHMNRDKRLKTLGPSSNSITEINKAISQIPSEPSLVDGEIKVCTSRKQTKKGKVSKELKTSKKVTFSINEGLNGKSVDDIPTTSEYVATKESQPLGEVHSSSKIESNPPGKTSATFLRKCDTLPCIRCAFCQSSEESDISGSMTHYFKGKPIESEHDGVPSAIHAHRNCTEWAPNVYFEDDIAVNLEAELARSKRIKCSCCGIKGAALGCYEKSCRRSFHFTCAKLTSECRWDDDNFVMLCPLHASHKLPNEMCGSQLQTTKKCVPKRHVNIKQSQVPVSDTVSTTSRWDSHGVFTKMVLCCSALTSIEKETIARFESLSGVMVLKKWDSRVTHVIASVDENGACRRTLKYLMGILEGKWILTIEYIKACLEVKKPVDEQLYEINLDIHGFKGGPKLGRSRLLNKEPKLFNAFKFYFTGDFVASYKGYLHDLILAAGGTVLHRKPIPINHEPQFSEGINAKQFIVYSLELPDKFKAEERNLILSQRKSDAEALARSSGAVAASNSWILNSIAACKLQNID